MAFFKMTDLNLSGKRVLIREDLNVPMQDGVITSEARITASLPTIQFALQANAAVILTSHLGRPTAGIYDETFSLAPVAKRLTELLGQPVTLVKNWVDGLTVKPGEVVLCENTRFLEGEQENDEALSKKMAALCDIYVNDAFATAHRKEVTTHGITRYVKQACAGPLLVKEIEAINKVMENPESPLVTIMGGSKLSTKLQLLDSLMKNSNALLLGGGIANTFLAAAGYKIGSSLCEMEFIDKAKQIMKEAQRRGIELPLLTDVVVATQITETAEATIKPVSTIEAGEIILDIGPKTAQKFAEILYRAKTILWNGPVGKFEIPAFTQGTKSIAQTISESKAYSLVGGGDTVAALEQYGLVDRMSYVSTAGGAFLAYLEEGTLPAIAALEEVYQQRGK